MKVKLWHVQQGPFHRDELPDTDDIPQGLEYMMIIKTERKRDEYGIKLKKKERVSDEEYWFPSFEQAMMIVDHFKKSIEPLKMDV